MALDSIPSAEGEEERRKEGIRKTGKYFLIFDIYLFHIFLRQGLSVVPADLELAM